MGAAVTAEIVLAGGRELLWVPKERSEDTWRRAREAGARACDLLAEALSRSAVILGWLGIDGDLAERAGRAV
ncbi:hypothetical protein [Streptomyces platensis]|uniref:hypothetical protein n=1 Tax=Streptomyces platensis TaxID=58346 RepID=UPI0037AF95BB